MPLGGFILNSSALTATVDKLYHVALGAGAYPGCRVCTSPGGGMYTGNRWILKHDSGLSPWDYTKGGVVHGCGEGCSRKRKEDAQTSRPKRTSRRMEACTASESA